MILFSVLRCKNWCILEINCFLMLFRSCMERCFNQHVWLNISFTFIKTNLKNVNCTNKVYLKTVILSVSRFAGRLDKRMVGVADRNLSWLALLR